MAWVFPIKLIDDVQLTELDQFVYGPELDLYGIANSFTMITNIDYEAGTATLDVNLQGSVDGDTWYGVGASVSVRPQDGGGNKITVVQASKPARYVRVALYSYDNSVTPTVSSVTVLAS